MSGTLNMHKVFKGTLTREGYLKALDLNGVQKRRLQDARDQIRRALRQGMPKWHDVAKSQGLIERRYIDLASTLPPLRPRFRMQGSSIYHTLNDPAHKPPQEVDYDDGVFLPTSFVNGGGAVEPILAAKGFFKVVEAILAPLCEENGWELDTTKSTCVRVSLDDEAHIDLPLYAIPDEEFVQLVEASARTMMAKGEFSSESDFELAEDVYSELPEDQIMLALRDSGWRESDPREVENWFLGAVREHGEVLRRVCRYLKGWRDFQWKTGGPSSITLMACAVTVFDDLDGTLPEKRDDVAIQIVADRLGGLFSTRIPNPVLPSQSLDDDWTPEQRLNFKAKASELKQVINLSLDGTFHPQIALSKLQEGFGVRIPEDEKLIDIDSEEKRIRAYEPVKVAAPTVPRTTSG